VCALKALHRKHRSSANLGARLQQEAAVNAQFAKHPNIAEVWDAGVTDDGRPYVVMDWLDGKSLRRRLVRGRRLDVDWACFVIKSVLAALARAHALGVVHRDIKPDNIYVCDDGLVKLIDFGVAKVLGSTFIQTGPGIPPGTFRYMSPEAIDGKTATPAMDLYSLGVTFWEMIVGQHPFLQGLPKDVVRAIMQDGVPPLDGILSVVMSTPSELCSVVMRACAGDPAERFASAEEFAAAIDDAMGYRPSTRPLAAGVYPPSYFGEAPSSMPPRAAMPAPPTVDVAATAPERSPGSALEPWAPTPRVALTDHASRSLGVTDSGVDDGRRALLGLPEPYQSSVLDRGGGVDSDNVPPQAPWLSKHPSSSQSPARRESEFGVLSHVPPFLWQVANSEAPEERTPSSTPPLVSGTMSKNDAEAAANDVDVSDSDEATTLPRGGAQPAGRRGWVNALPLRRVAERLRAAGVTKRAMVAAGAGALTLAALGFLMGQIWGAPTGPRRASSAQHGAAAGQGVPLRSAGPLAPLPSTAPRIATSVTALAAPPAEAASAPSGVAGGARSPSPPEARGVASTVPSSASLAVPAAPSAQGSAAAPKRETTRAAPKRGAGGGTAPTARPTVRLPKGGLDSGF
jgi:serine/threonine protein kinase